MAMDIYLKLTGAKYRDDMCKPAIYSPTEYGVMGTTLEVRNCRWISPGRNLLHIH